jgi:hypothetical protein
MKKTTTSFILFLGFINAAIFYVVNANSNWSHWKVWLPASLLCFGSIASLFLFWENFKQGKHEESQKNEKLEHFFKYINSDKIFIRLDDLFQKNNTETLLKEINSYREFLNNGVDLKDLNQVNDNKDINQEMIDMHHLALDTYEVHCYTKDYDKTKKSQIKMFEHKAFGSINDATKEVCFNLLLAIAKYYFIIDEMDEHINLVMKAKDEPVLASFSDQFTVIAEELDKVA